MKKTKRLVYVLLLTIMMSMFPIESIAAENIDDFQEVTKEQITIVESSSADSIRTLSDPSLTACELGIGISSNGVGVTFITTATTTATEIGCKDMVLQEKTALGWKDITIRDHYDYDTDVYAGSVVYLKAVVGKTYRVYCTHYAVIDDVEYTLYNITDSIVYN